MTNRLVQGQVGDQQSQAAPAAHRLRANLLEMLLDANDFYVEPSARY
jgi:hypothetical protein